MEKLKFKHPEIVSEIIMGLSEHKDPGMRREEVLALALGEESFRLFNETIDSIVELKNKGIIEYRVIKEREGPQAPMIKFTGYYKLTAKGKEIIEEERAKNKSLRREVEGG